MKPIADPSLSTQLRVNRANHVSGMRMTGPWFAVYAVVALAAIFYLPRLIPMAPSASDSYLFGYNNRAGIVLLCLFVAVGVILTRGFGIGVAEISETRRVPREMLLWSVGLVALGCAVMYLFAGRYNGFGESFYLIDRIWLLHIGRVPYKEFEFAYGPGQLYGPLLLDRILQIGIPQSYYLFWALSYLFGTYFLFKAIDAIDFPSAKKPWIFAMLFGAGLFAIIRMGTNYTFLRYALPIYLVLQIHRRFRDSRAASIVADVLLSGVFCGILILFSPEMAVAFAFAALGICVLQRSLPLPIRGITAGLLIGAFALTFFVALRLHVLDAMLADGGGAISFPIVPSPTILVYFAAVFVCACYLYRALLRPSNSNVLGLVLFSVPMVAAALGRCDPSHVFWNGLAVFLPSLLFLSLNRRAWIVGSSAFLICVFLAPNLSEFYLFVPQLRSARHFNKHPEVQPSQEKIENLLASWPGNYIAPFGYRPDGFGTYHSPRIEFGRFEDLIDVSTPHSVSEKVGEMRGNPDKALILPYRPDEYCRTNQRAESHFLEVLLLFPHIGSFVHSDFARAPICRYLNAHYRMLVEPKPETFWYGVWIPDSAARSNMPGSD
jgi:hypothetical protein